MKAVQRVALVTGGGRRVGKSIVQRLAAEGYTLAIHASGSIAEARALAESLPHAQAFQADLADPAAAETLIDTVANALGPPSILINSAAGFSYDTAGSFEYGDLAHHLALNLGAPVTLVRDMARALGAKPGMVVNILDHKITALNPDFFTYTLAKAALAAATSTIAMSFGGRIRVNGVAPGIALLSGNQSEEGFARAWQAPPLRRSTTPDEIAEAVVYLLQTPSLNGQMLVLDGGESLLQRPRDVAFDPHVAPDADGAAI